MNDKLCIAFERTRDGYSADRVVADPILNDAFIQACHLLGINEDTVELNLKLLNLRKAGHLKGRPRARKTSFSDQASYRFASEIAARFIERRDTTTLDRIICDPALAQDFDRLASEIAPGYMPLQYRWAALNLRKARVLRPEILARVVEPSEIRIHPVSSITASDLPSQQGLYIFYCPTELLYVGEAQNLRNRVSKHLDHSDNKNLARWLWSNGFDEVFLELRILAPTTPLKIRKALECELIRNRRPAFNIQSQL